MAFFRGILKQAAALRPSLRGLLLSLTLLAASAYFASLIGERYPLKEWLFFRYARYWGCAVYFTLACVTSGHRLLLILSPKRRALIEHLALAFPTGLFAFYLGVFGFGLLGALNLAFALLWPAALIAFGARSLFRYVVPRVRRAHYLRSRIPALQPGLLPRLFVAFGGANLVILYLTILSPENVGYDTRWYHLAIAEHYAAGGRVGPFVEGWYHGTLPHLASFIYTWAFLVPGNLFDRIVLSAHLEYVVLLWLLVGVGPLTRRLMPKIRAPGTWVAFFLFHQLLMQSNFATGNDTFAALWAIPVYLAFLDAWRKLEPRACVLLGLMLAGAMSTKYQTMSVVAFPIAAIAFRALWGALVQLFTTLRRKGGALRASALSWIKGPLAAGGGYLAFTAPVWLKNWIWHGDPLYPFLYKYLHERPWTADAAHLVEAVLEPELWKPRGPLLGRIKETLPWLYQFSFKPNDFYGWNHLTPLFGSLLTLTVPALLFVRASRRVWGLVLAVHVGVFAWYWTHHQDRYLILIVPWMAAVVACVLVLGWRQGWLPRLALIALVGLEVVWGGDASFLPIHPMVGDTVLKTSIDLINSGFRQRYEERFNIYGPIADVGRALPKKARVLVHEIRLHLGINAMTVNDFGGGFQGGIAYGRWQTPGKVYDHLREFGVTHVLWIQGSTTSYESLAGDLMFFDFATRNLQQVTRYGHLTLGKMPDKRPADARWHDMVAYLGCGQGYHSGVYHVEQMTVSWINPTDPYPRPIMEERSSPIHFTDMGFIVNDRACRLGVPAPLQSLFHHAADHGSNELWIRNAD